MEVGACGTPKVGLLMKPKLYNSHTRAYVFIVLLWFAHASNPVWPSPEERGSNQQHAEADVASLPAV